MKVLIIDDEEDTRSIASMSLSILGGLEVLEAESGHMGISMAEKEQPDVILLDLAMPVMNGLEAARALKRLMPNVPIVMFSAYADSFTGSAFCGVSVLVSKFEDMSALVGIARNLVGAIAA